MHLGFIELIVSPDFDLTNSLLMNNPRGCLYLWPFGAVSSTKRSDMLLPAVWYLAKVPRFDLTALSVNVWGKAAVILRGEALKREV